jgi:hypothetical protein
VTIARFPLPLRNALAELVIAGLEEEDDAAAALRWLAAPATPPVGAAAARLAAVHLIDTGGTALLEVHAPHVEAAAAHAARALRAREVYRGRTAPAATPEERAVRQAAALWNEHLFFEVHEVLEAVWKTAAGDLRQALQGLIQIAVAFHHHAHGNLRGARSLLVEGRARLAAAPPGTVAANTEALLTATAPMEGAFRDATTAVSPPRLELSA